MAVIGDLVTRLGVDGRKFQSGLDKARGDARSFVADITKIVSGIALYDIGKSAATGLFGLGKSTVELAATAETAAVQFKVLTGSAEEAASVMKQINKFAADTPFESMEITQAAKQLIAFGGSSQTVISELQTLGDLASGMGIPLGELAEIYGKARIQGRLFMEDINQLQGRGINVTAQLAKEFGNVRQAVEKGQVNFSHLEKALKAMTIEGGAFAGMMVEMSDTFDGKVSTLIDNVKTLGRGIGEMLLPPLKNVVSEANNILSKFNEMPDKVRFLGDVVEAAFDVGIKSIQVKWDEMLFAMLKSTKGFAVDVAWELVGMGDGGAAAAGLKMGAGADKSKDLEAAQNRFAGLIEQLKPDAPFVGPRQQFPFVGPRQKEAVDGSKLKNLVGDIWNKVSPIADAAGFAAQGIVDRTKIRAEAFMGTLSNIFTAEPEKAQRVEPRLAGAMQAGSQEAYSTIVQAMIRQADPVVKATEKQTREFVKAIKKIPATRLAYVAAFEE
jgi:hypothetical protein